MDRLNNQLDLIEVLVPEMKDLFLRRYKLLKLVDTYGPIGRRNLAQRSLSSERQVRNDADFLREQGMVDFLADGTVVTSKGQAMIELLEDLAHHYSGIEQISKLTAKLLGINEVLIVDAPEDDSEAALAMMGKAAGRRLLDILKDDDILGLTGGTSVQSLVENIETRTMTGNHLIVVPARGGLGNSTRYQANTLAEQFARKLGGEYGPLYMPDSLSPEAIRTLMAEPHIRETVRLIHQISCLVFGIGKADVMAKRRDLDPTIRHRIIDSGAVAEAFGYYFNAEGEMVDEISTFGISLEQFKSLDRLIAIAGGADKARAIVSISKLNRNLVLVTDLKCAREMINILRR